MSDTQWPRYYVFKQDSVESKHQSCGTVHAPDPEMALQIARDVFVRRPDCHSLWVAPAEEILAPGGQSTATAAERSPAASKENEYLIFVRPNQRDPHIFQARIEAVTAARALEEFVNKEPELAKLGAWVVPAESIHASQVGHEEAWFRPAEKKEYRHGSFYHPDKLLRDLRTGDGK